MKILVAALLTLSAFSTFASDVRTTVLDLEQIRNAKCTRTYKGFKSCVGLSMNIPSGPEYARARREAEASRVCYYKVKLDCVSNSGDFQVELSVRESINGETVTEMN